MKIVDSMEVDYSDLQQNYISKLDRFLLSDSLAKANSNRLSKRNIYNRAEAKINGARSAVSAITHRMRANIERQDKYWVEIHKKFSLPAACIVFILIGAPLGTMTRRGGIGVAGGISLLFFLVYWAFLIAGEKFADRGMLSPFWGMWSANVVLGLLGIWLTVKAAKEKVTLSFDFMRFLIPKRFRHKSQNNV